MTTRRDLYALADTEVTAFVDALNAMKASGTYDGFVERHLQAMMQPSLMAGETTSDTQRNVAHRGPAFLPWHRQVLVEFETALGVALPYWRWEVEGSGWRTARVWTIIGGNGDSTQDWRVTTGPFVHWTTRIWNSRTGSFVDGVGIRRQFSTRGNLPSRSQARSLLGLLPYDSPDWDEVSSGFRVGTESRHNIVHTRIGGDMRTATSPNDPVFWLHHANLDRIWAAWQARNPSAGYLPAEAGPPGHNLNDEMAFVVSSGVTPVSVLDIAAIGYAYDTLGV